MNVINDQFMPICYEIGQIVTHHGLNEKIVTVACALFVSIGCVVYIDNLVLLANKAFYTFYDLIHRKGKIVPILMVTSYLGLKYLIHLQLNSHDSSYSFSDYFISIVKNIPASFMLGACNAPQYLLLSISINIVVNLLFKFLSIDSTIDGEYDSRVRQVSCYTLAIKGPFLEELFFREIVQGSLISILQLVNIAPFFIENGGILTENTLFLSARIISSVAFGLVHYKQCKSQAVTAGLLSYYYMTCLYEKSGLLASFGTHFGNNLAIYSLLKICTKLTSSFKEEQDKTLDIQNVPININNLDPILL